MCPYLQTINVHVCGIEIYIKKHDIYRHFIFASSLVECLLTWRICFIYSLSTSRIVAIVVNVDYCFVSSSVWCLNASRICRNDVFVAICEFSDAVSDVSSNVFLLCPMSAPFYPNLCPSLAKNAYPL